MKKFTLKTMAMTLALCLIAAVMPMPTAQASDATTLFPVEIDFDIDVQPAYWVTGEATKGIDAFPDSYPTVENDGYAIDFSNSTATGAQMKIYADTSSTEGYIEARMAGVKHKLTLNVKAPAAGTYNVFLREVGIATQPDAGTVTVNGVDIGTYAFTSDAKNEKITNSITITDETELTIVFTSSIGTANFRANGVVFVPVGSVNAKFYDETRTDLNGVSPATDKMSYAINGCELGAYSLEATDFKYAKYTYYGMGFRGKAGKYITFKAWVPETGSYQVNIINAGKHETSGTWSVYVDGDYAGDVDLREKDGDNLMENYVTLNAGENEVKLVFKTHYNALPGDETPWDNSNNRLVGFTLTPFADSNAEASAIFGNTSAYVTATEEGKLMLKTFSAIDSTNYSKVGFIINGEDTTVETKVYDKVTVNYSDAEKEAFDITPDMFFVNIEEPENACIFFSETEVTAGETVTVQPYAVSLDGKTTIKGQTYEIEL